ncbi:MAG: alanine racemase [Eubacterium sp.]
MEIDKYFRCYAEINLDAIHKNVESMKEKLEPKTGIIAVIKTDGYGHGAVPIAKVLDDLCYGYAVATAYEGHNLRRHDITKPLFILGYTPECTYDMVIAEEMIPPVFSLEMAVKLSEHAQKLNKTVKINIAVDTGMSRIGYIPSDSAIEEIVRINDLPNLKIESVFTHFAKADYADKGFARKQLKEFMEFVTAIEERGIKIPIHQCANSAAIMEMPETSLNLSRAGISMYGLYPSEEMSRKNMKLYPAMSIYSHVVFVKEIEAGRGISYGQTFVAEHPMKIATIPIGYGDGYPRNLSNKGYVLIHGRKADIVGRVCMDQFMVDVTGMDVKTGDVVTIAGKDGGEEIFIDDLAALAGTFNYEFVCDLGKRVPRVFVKNNKIVGMKDYYDDDYEIML